MNRAGEQGDVVPADLVTEVLAGHADPGGAGGSQYINVQVVPLLGVHRVSGRHRSQASMPVLLAMGRSSQVAALLLVTSRLNAATVLSVGDGDTITVRDEGTKVHIRLACIDALETSQSPYGKESREQ